MHWLLSGPDQNTTPTAYSQNKLHHQSGIKFYTLIMELNRVFEMKNEREKQDLTCLDADELKRLFHRINSQLARNLLNGAGIDSEKQRIQMLNEISEELNRRNFVTKSLPQ